MTGQRADSRRAGRLPILLACLLVVAFVACGRRPSDEAAARPGAPAGLMVPDDSALLEFRRLLTEE